MTITKYPEQVVVRDGFKRWNGGTAPVAGVWVEYLLRMDPGQPYGMEVDELVWSHDGGGGDIIAYRVVEE